MRTHRTIILPRTAIVLTIAFLGISCSKDSSSPVDAGSSAPSAATAPSPADGATLQPISLGLKWSCSPSSGETLTYDVYLGTTNPPTSTIATNMNQSTLAQTALSNLTVYYWQVVSKSSKGTSTKGPVWQFTTGIAGMIAVEGGTFKMGDDGSTDAWQKPAHNVTLSSFFIGQYEVIQKQWREVVQWKQGTTTSPLNPAPSLTVGDSLPVTHVSWDDIQTWLGYLNEKEALSSSTKKYRLPTEAEWEFAARGGNNSKGYKYSGSAILIEVAWFNSNSDLVIHKVGTKAPNELGIYDMSGNVLEWCNDGWGSYTSAAQTNPIGSTDGSNRVMRGGSALENGDWCIATYRDAEAPNVRSFGSVSKSDGYGFRYVRTQ